MTQAERARLSESPHVSDGWRLWGPYVSGRQWGTVREDYSDEGDAWTYFPFEHAHQRAYRWGEDGLAGLCDRYGFLNVGIALWNGHDDRLKERLFGLSNPEGNHGEDVKEYWWPLDATPTHSWAEWLYRYPQSAFPYEQLRSANASRTKSDPEFELADTGALSGDRFFDVLVRHAKESPTDICIVVEVTNRAAEPAPLHVLPHVWFRNTWAWGRDDRVPTLRHIDPAQQRDGSFREIVAEHGWLGRYVLAADGEPDVVVCDNDTHDEALFASSSRTPYPKDGINRLVVQGDSAAVNPFGTGTKAAFWYRFDSIAPGATVQIKLRLVADAAPERPFGSSFDAVLADRRAEADEFYRSVIPSDTSSEDTLIARRAFAGLLWGKHLYRYRVDEWLDGDPGQPTPPASRLSRGARNTGWRNVWLTDVMSMPDEWEYPWFAAWDLSFHCVALAHLAPAFAKEQLLLLCSEWAMHPSGQLPAYEWAFGDVNPPVHAWAAWHVYTIDGGTDREFLVRVFTKLLLNFSWWVNRKDADGSNLFEGGFLGMDNIGLFDRSMSLPAGHRLEQSDATSWMAFYCLSMLRIALELAREDQAWDDIATKFLEHFLAIAAALTQFGSQNVALWDETDGFFYDVLIRPDDSWLPLKVRSMVGLLPLLAVELAPSWVARELPDFTNGVRWMLEHRPDRIAPLVTSQGPDGSHLTLSLVGTAAYLRVLKRVLDEDEFLAPYGIRSLSAAYREGFVADVEGLHLSMRYTPAESDSGMFGGNSNWRGPIWFPVNVLLADAIGRYAAGSGGDLKVEFPTGSGQSVSLGDVASSLRDRLVALFRPGKDGRRPSTPAHHPTGPLWDAHPTFSEYFNGDTGAGLGASHQTGWTALVAHLVCHRPGPEESL